MPIKHSCVPRIRCSRQNGGEENIPNKSSLFSGYIHIGHICRGIRTKNAVSFTYLKHSCYQLTYDLNHVKLVWRYKLKFAPKQINNYHDTMYSKVLLKYPRGVCHTSLILEIWIASPLSGSWFFGRCKQNGILHNTWVAFN